MKKYAILPVCAVLLAGWSCCVRGSTWDFSYGYDSVFSANAEDYTLGMVKAFKHDEGVAKFCQPHLANLDEAVITEIIDSTGDGMGSALDNPWGIAVDDSGNVYVIGSVSNNAFKITSVGLITEIIDSSGDGMGNSLDSPLGIAVDDSGNAYVTGSTSDNAFKIMPDGVITKIIDQTGDGMGNSLDSPLGIAADNSGNTYVTGSLSNNAFRITLVYVPDPDIDQDGDVDFLDFAALASKWHDIDCSELDWCGRTDIDHSGATLVFQICRF